MSMGYYQCPAAGCGSMFRTKSPRQTINCEGQCGHIKHKKTAMTFRGWGWDGRNNVPYPVIKCKECEAMDRSAE